MAERVGESSLAAMPDDLLAAGCRNLLRQELPDNPDEAATWLNPLREWRRRWEARKSIPSWGPGSRAELDVLISVIEELERIAADA